MTTNIKVHQNLSQLIVCPICQGKLEFSSKLVQCTACSAKFPQIANDLLDLLPKHLLENEDSQWEERLIEMEDWYNDLITKPRAANECFMSDYEPFSHLLAKLWGNILDLGGGIGIPRNYLNNDASYIVIDPSIEWLKTDYSPLINNFPCLKSKPNFVRGIGEYLPFQSQSFDAVISFWSLNHASNPKMVFSEVARVLRPGGTFLIVLEDMIPQWFDLVNPKFPAINVFNSFFNLEYQKKMFFRIRLFFKLMKCKNWPLQHDHIRILESEINNWTAQNLEIAQRRWIKHYLTFEFKKVKVYEY